jgi:hypothetical protein
LTPQDASAARFVSLGFTTYVVIAAVAASRSWARTRRAPIATNVSDVVVTV